MIKPSSKLAVRTVVIISGIMITVGLSGCSNPLSKSNNVVKVVPKKATISILTLKPENMNIDITGSGYILPARTTSLYYNNLSGTLKKLSIKLNDQVKVGQPISEIQASDLQNKISDQETVMKRWPIRISQLDEDINSSKASMNLAKLNLSSAKKNTNASEDYKNQLKLQYDISASAYKNAKWSKELADIDYDKDHETLSELKAQMSQVVLKAPTNGVVTFVENLSENAMVSSGLVIARVAESRNMLFRLTASDAEYISNANKAVLTINKKDYEVSLYTPQPGDQLSNSGNDQNSNNYTYLRFNKMVPPIKINALVDATLKVYKNQALVLPKELVYQEAGKNLVDIQYGKEIKTIEVTEGLATSDKVEIVSGLKSGDRIIVR